MASLLDLLLWARYPRDRDPSLPANGRGPKLPPASSSYGPIPESPWGAIVSAGQVAGPVVSN
jgi:hypothetical protein